ncbi:MAG: T9SS type A sorting domain-containing protein [Bacteroidaceae bacterium]|nr:T9SS type A sorting domain-containing protein [Bacteroidaceae bacterium]
MKRLRINWLFVLVWVHALSYGQPVSLGLECHTEIPAYGYHINYYPRLKMPGNTLYVPTKDGIYMKDLKRDSQWTRCGFEGMVVQDFVWNRKMEYLAALYDRDGRDSLLVLDPVGLGGVENLTPQLSGGINQICRLVQNPLKKESLLCLGYDGIYRSYNFGKTWESINPIDPLDASAFLAYHPLDTSLIFVGGRTPYSEGVILKSPDGGKTWDEYKTPAKYDRILDVSFHWAHPSAMFYGGTGCIGRSMDRGEKWEIVLADAPMAFSKVVPHPRYSNIIYATGRHESNDSIYIYRSLDMGEQWHVAARYHVDGAVCAFDMCIHENDLILYCSNGIYKVSMQDIPSQVGSLDISTPAFRLEQGVLYSNAGQKMKSIEVFTVSGELIFCHEGVSSSISLSSLGKGIYILQVVMEDGTVCKQKINVK